MLCFFLILPSRNYCKFSVGHILIEEQRNGKRVRELMCHIVKEREFDTRYRIQYAILITTLKLLQLLSEMKRLLMVRKVINVNILSHIWSHRTRR
jgi:hypothetical protein